jgi:hypothetical protein
MAVARVVDARIDHRPYAKLTIDGEAPSHFPGDIVAGVVFAIILRGSDDRHIQSIRHLYFRYTCRAISDDFGELWFRPRDHEASATCARASWPAAARNARTSAAGIGLPNR